MHTYHLTIYSAVDMKQFRLHKYLMKLLSQLRLM